MSESDGSSSQRDGTRSRIVNDTGAADDVPIRRRAALGLLGTGLAWLGGCSALESVSDGSTADRSEDGVPTKLSPKTGTKPTESEKKSDESDTLQERGKSEEIVPGTTVGFPPFEIRNDDGDIDGFDVELLEAIVAETDYTVREWKNVDFKSLVPSLTSEKIDVIAAAMTITEERKQTISFTHPYYSADQAIIVRNGGRFRTSDIDDLSGQTLGALKGTNGESVVRDVVQNADYRDYNSYVLALQDLENQNLDAVLLDKPVAESFLATRNPEIAFIYETGEQYGFGIRDADDELVAALNDGLQTVRDEGTYQELVIKWFGDA